MSEEYRDRPVVVVERSEGGLGSFLFGLTIGAGLALLLAPKTGEETREQLKTTGRKLRTAAIDAAEDLQDAISGRYDTTKDRIEHGITTARGVVKEKREDAREALDAGKAAVKSARSELEKRLAKSKRTRTRSRAKKNAEPADDES